jgi:DNA-directed RNA polymerase specialized sigma24 family protein
MSEYKPYRGKGLSIDPHVFEFVETSQAMWHETSQEQEKAWRDARRRNILLGWVRRRMIAYLTDREQDCIRMYFFDAMTYAQMGDRTDTNATSCFRAVQRGIRRLRNAAQREGVTWESGGEE